MGGVRLYWVGFAALAVLAGCGRGWFEEREPWRRDAEQQCLKSGAVRQGPAVTLLRPIDGPGMCGADFPLKVAALGDSPVLSYTGELRPPGSVPNAGAPIPPPSQPYPPLYPSAPVTSSPLPPQSYDPGRTDLQTSRDGASPLSLNPSAPVDPQGANDGAPRYLPSRGALPDRAGDGVQQGYRPPGEPDFADDDPDDDIVHEDAARALGDSDASPRGEYDFRDRARAQPVPRVTAPARSPRAIPQQVPLGPQRMPIQTTATVTPAATLACPIVSALDRWIVDAVQPAAQRWFNQPVTEIRQISAYSCRGMNGQAGARISEHAFGNALDVSAFTLADGRQITVKSGWRGLPEEQGFLRDVQAAACAQFTTVLAPGSNAYHYDHIHVDLMRRSSGRTICEPAAALGAEVAARAARGGNALARRDDGRERMQSNPPFDARNDPFSWRGTARGRDGTPTGSVTATGKRRVIYDRRHEPVDDEDALQED
jgi:hypothetical protein